MTRADSGVRLDTETPLSGSNEGDELADRW
jgi:hypothetical protein